MKIEDVTFSQGRTGFFFDDQRAIKRGARPDGAAYEGPPVTPGFHKVRQAGESVSVLLLLDDGRLAWGDCAAVQYSGAGGRDPLFLARDFIPYMEANVAPVLRGREVTTFREMAGEIDALRDPETGLPMHTAIRYGVTQVALDAVAQSQNRLMTEVVAQEYGLTVSDTGIPIFAQSGDSRYENTDKMILKGADVLPHGLINHVPSKLGEDGGLLVEYVGWLKKRIARLRPREDYRPVLHIDVYGTIGLAFHYDMDRIVGYFEKLAKAAAPYRIRIEGPVDVEDREKQMLALRELTRRIDDRGIGLELVADEWCNTLEDIRYFADNRAGHMVQIKTPDLGGIQNIVEAVLYCRKKGVGAYMGGSCNETDRSAQVCVHLAMAARPDQMLAKPGMGVDEGYMLVYNEMQRILAIRKARAGSRM